MQDEREDEVAGEDVEGHRWRAEAEDPEQGAERASEESAEDEDEVEAHRWPRTGPEEFGKRF